MMRTRSPVFPAAALAACVAIAGTVPACATIGLGPIQPLSFEEADERGSELRLLPPSTSHPLGGAALRIWTRVRNPNSFGLTLTEVAGDLTLEGADALAVDFPLGLPLAAFQDTLVPLDVSIGFEDVPGLAGIAGTVIRGDALDYRLDGTFSVDAGSLGSPRFGPWTLLEGEVRIR